MYFKFAFVLFTLTSLTIAAYALREPSPITAERTTALASTTSPKLSVTTLASTSAPIASQKPKKKRVIVSVPKQVPKTTSTLQSNVVPAAVPPSAPAPVSTPTSATTSVSDN